MSFGTDDRRFYDEFTRFKRYVEDALENIDYDSFSAKVKKMITESARGSAGFEASADTERAFARIFAEYKTDFSRSLAEIRATADADRATIESIAVWKDEAIKSIASIEQLADENSSDLKLLTKWKDETDAELEDISTSIASIEASADSAGAFISMLAVSGGYDIDLDKGYTYDKTANSYTFKDSVGNDVIITEEHFAGIYISAMNNNAFEIKLNADVIKLGDSASVDGEGNLRVKRLYHYGGNQFYAQVGNDAGSFADFGVYDETNGYWAWRFFNNDMATKVIHLRIYEEDILGYNGSENKTYPKGVWDFSACNVIGIPLYFS